jgi:glutamate-1-semialdehyde 2,1-aminomutase
MTNSEIYLNKAIKRIPWGTQTNAKRPILEYSGIMPFYIERASGCRIFDIDGGEFIDYRLSLGPVTLGYCYPEVDEAVKKQMDKGVIFSMASPIEYELAELLNNYIPSAEKVRFMKTGEDANSSLIRIARAYTKKDMIITCGYHGYPDWFMTSSVNNGVPKFMGDYVKEIPWGDFEKAEEIIKKFAKEIACVIAVPYDFNENTSPEFIQGLKKLTEEYEIILIFDEVLTGFRLTLGGAQEYFGITPDLSSFAKAMANGYPISSFVGKEKYMNCLNDMMITTTYAGETLSMAAAIATINIMKRENVHQHIWKMGERLMSGFNQICKELSVEGHAVGLPPGSFIKFGYKDSEYNSKLDFIFHRELYRNGIFANIKWFISYSHKEKDIDETLDKTKIALKRTLNYAN